MKMLLFPLLVLCCLSCKNGPDKQVQPSVTKPIEQATATPEQQERRKRSEAYCNAHLVPIYTDPNSLFTDPEADVTIRTKDEVVDRALALCYIGLKSEGLEQGVLDKIDKDLEIFSKLSANEKAYATAKQPTQQQRIDANWRYESLHVMLWALGFIDSLAYPDTLCNVAADVKIIHDLTGTEFRNKAKLRSKKEILDQADLILRLDWACVNARLENKVMPGHLDSGVVLERHHSLNWLIRYMEQDWDNVSTDT